MTTDVKINMALPALALSMHAQPTRHHYQLPKWYLNDVHMYLGTESTKVETCRKLNSSSVVKNSQ